MYRIETSFWLFGAWTEYVPGRVAETLPILEAIADRWYAECRRNGVTVRVRIMRAVQWEEVSTVESPPYVKDALRVMTAEEYAEKHKKGNIPPVPEKTRETAVNSYAKQSAPIMGRMATLTTNDTK